MDIRSDFRDAGPGLPRLLVLANAFDENDDRWSHLRNREDFKAIWQRPEPERKAFERLYAEGREMALSMQAALTAFEDVSRFPALGGYVRYLERWASELDGFVQTRDTARAFSDAGTPPWAVGRMLELFDGQLEMFREVVRVIGRLRESPLFLWDSQDAAPGAPGVVAPPVPAVSGKDGDATADDNRGLGRPTVFISYSHDSQEHRAWVKALADQLARDGVDVRLDQYDLKPGEEMSSFMERAVGDAGRIVVVCSKAYVEKANALKGGAGYEKTLLSRELLRSQRGNPVIPVIRNNDANDPLPDFLGTRMYVDFRSDPDFSDRYQVLLRAIYDQPAAVRPPLGPSPFVELSGERVGIPGIAPRQPQLDRFGTPGVAFGAGANLHAVASTVTFNYSDNDGYFSVGEGELRFNTRWTTGSKTAIHVYNDAENIMAIALANDADAIVSVRDTGVYDTSSRERLAMVGDIVLWWNDAGATLATRIEAIECRAHGDPHDVVSLSYVAIPSGYTSFSRLP